MRIDVIDISIDNNRTTVETFADEFMQLKRSDMDKIKKNKILI